LGPAQAASRSIRAQKMLALRQFRLVKKMVMNSTSVQRRFAEFLKTFS
jgi:hypothetical protein